MPQFHVCNNAQNCSGRGCAAAPRHASHKVRFIPKTKHALALRVLVHASRVQCQHRDCACGCSCRVGVAIFNFPFAPASKSLPWQVPTCYAASACPNISSIVTRMCCCIHGDVCVALTRTRRCCSVGARNKQLACMFFVSHSWPQPHGVHQRLRGMRPVSLHAALVKLCSNASADRACRVRTLGRSLFSRLVPFPSQKSFEISTAAAAQHNHHQHAPAAIVQF